MTHDPRSSVRLSNTNPAHATLDEWEQARVDLANAALDLIAAVDSRGEN